MDSVNQKIIDAVIAKAKKVCPDSLALIGIYGSVATGDAYEKSDLDLLILIENNEGWQLGTGFILDDSNIGYDIYCTNWDGLKEPSQDLTGTYEEMYSNWRNKVAEAAKQDNAVASFINMCNFYYMVAEIGDEVEIGNFNIMELYNPDCLQDNVELFDMCLQKYEDVYKSAGIEVKRFSNVDVFVTNYLCE